MSELIVGDGYLKLVEPEYRMEPEIRAEMREAVAAYREQQIEQGIREFALGMAKRAAQRGFWLGVSLTTLYWLLALWFTIALRDVLASAWRAL